MRRPTRRTCQGPPRNSRSTTPPPAKSSWTIRRPHPPLSPRATPTTLRRHPRNCKPVHHRSARGLAQHSHADAPEVENVLRVHRDASSSPLPTPSLPLQPTPSTDGAHRPPQRPLSPQLGCGSAITITIAIAIARLAKTNAPTPPHGQRAPLARFGADPLRGMDGVRAIGTRMTPARAAKVAWAPFLLSRRQRRVCVCGTCLGVLPAFHRSPRPAKLHEDA